MWKWKLYYLPFGLGVLVVGFGVLFFGWLGFFKAYSAVTENVGCFGNWQMNWLNIAIPTRCQNPNSLLLVLLCHKLENLENLRNPYC